MPQHAAGPAVTDAASTNAAAAAQARGIVAMMISALLLMLGDSIAKILLETYPIGQVIAIRQLAALAVILACRCQSFVVDRC